MAKILIIGDLHFGAKNGDQATADYQLRVCEEFIFPLIDRLGIKHIIQTGDFFDSRKAIRHDTMEMVRKRFVPRTVGQQWYVLVGNHDMHRRESIFPNSCQELLAQYPNFDVFNNPTTITIDGVKIDMIPWICRDNRRQVMEFIGNSSSPICVGHFELSGFEYYKGLASEGEKSDFLSNYNWVWSGHFHTISKSKHIQYVGTPYQLTFGDADDDRGVWVYDTDDGSFEFISNGMPRFSRIYFDHTTFDTTNLERYKDMLLRVEVKDRGDSKKFDKLMDKLSTIAAELTIRDVVDVSGANATSSAGLSNLLTTNQIIEKYIDGLDETESDRTKIKTLVQGLLAEASQI